MGRKRDRSRQDLWDDLPPSVFSDQFDNNEFLSLMDREPLDRKHFRRRVDDYHDARALRDQLADWDDWQDEQGIH